MRLAERDRLLSFDGHPLAGIDDLHRLLTDDRVGRPVNVEAIRDGERLDLEVIPAESGA